MTLLFSHLLIMAQKKKLANYRTPAQAMGMFSAALGGHLEKLFKLNTENNDPLYGALIVNKSDQMPSKGFFDAAKRHNLVEEFESEDSKRTFWQDAVDRVFGKSKVSKFLEGLNPDQIAELRQELQLRA